MKRPRIGRSTRQACYRDQLLESMGKHLPAKGLPLIAVDGRIRWTDRLLVIVAILMSWSMAASQQDAFAEARDVAVRLYSSRRRPGRTLTGFLKAWTKRTAGVLAVVVRALQRASLEAAGVHWRVGLWVVMGVDGTRVECPRTLANEQAFGCAGKDKTTPQQFLTLIFHVATGLLWDWRRGRGDEAERTQAREMLVGLPDRTLLLADAGFTGYDLLGQIQSLGHDFIVRVGRNVHLLRDVKVNKRANRVYLWPQGRRTEAPRQLRLVKVRQAKRRMYLLTSVLDASVLSDDQICDLYRQRWGIEVTYRSLKQTMGKRKLRSDSPAAAQAELDWAMVGLWLLGLMAVRANGGGGVPWSVARSLRAVRTAMRSVGRVVRHAGLTGDLRRAVRDGYRRRGVKAARNWPRKKTERPPGPPHIRMMTEAERRKMQRLVRKGSPNSLAA